MNKQTVAGILVGGVFAAIITWVAMFDALEEGGFVLLSTGIFGLAAGVCIGGLVAANFVLLGLEEKEKHEVVAHRQATAHSPA